MEHQSAIAYGNDYLPGYHGSLAYSGGLEFDYIIISPGIDINKCTLSKYLKKN